MLVDLSMPPRTQRMQIYFDKIEVGQSMTKMAVSDIAIAYLIDMNMEKENSRNIIECDWPVWAITSPDHTVETVEMIGG
jgi:hypothetical protein